MREKKLIQANTVDCRKTSKKNARHYSRDYLVLGNGNSKGKALPWLLQLRLLAPSRNEDIELINQ